MSWAGLRSWLAVLVLAGGAAGVVAAVIIDDARPVNPHAAVATDSQITVVIDQFFTEDWSQRGVSPADLAEDLTVLRRASLALHGTVPSLEEIRSYEADASPDRLQRRVRQMLGDSRFADYFSERLARAWVGVEREPFLVYRRDRFTRWLAEELQANRPFDELARDVLSTDGLWTSEPAANFVTAAIANDELDYNELASRTVRGFLGQRIDCAQCHDHPFAAWKPSEFEGLAAFFGQSAISYQGIVDQPHLFENALEFTVDDPATESRRVVEPAVPFLAECLPAEGPRRERLAAWVTDSRNERFARATVNRVWGLLFGRPYVDPVDDLPDPGDERTLLLDQLAVEFRDSGHDLKGLIEGIILSRPFRTASSLPGTDAASYERAEEAWGVFPLVRLRPEQVIGAMIQAGRLQTIDQNSHLVARAIRFLREQDFVNEYGDAGENELAARSGTVPQALLRMNGRLMGEIFAANPFSSTGRLAALSANEEEIVEAAFLITLARRPTAEERGHFVPLIEQSTPETRTAAIEDLLWSLVNSAEFSWNH